MNDCQPERDACNNCIRCCPEPEPAIVPARVETKGRGVCDVCLHDCAAGSSLCHRCNRNEEADRDHYEGYDIVEVYR